MYRFASLLVLASVGCSVDAQAETPTSDSVGHCAAAETSLFHCEVSKSKHISLCQTADKSGIQYRFGAVGTVELSFPKDASTATSVFTYEEKALARSFERDVRFTNKAFSYTVFEVTGGAGDAGAGVSITENDKLLATVPCLNETWTEDFDTIKAVLSAK